MKKGGIKITYKKTVFHIPYFLFAGSGPETEVIVYFHGLGCRKEDFINVALDKKMGSFSHFAFDFPGSGQAPYPKNISLNFYDLVEITHKVLKKLKFKKLILVGHSSGGIAALLYAYTYPAEVKKFINVEGTLTPENTWYSEQIKNGGWNFAKFKSTIYPKIVAELKTIKYPGFRKYLESLKHTTLRSFFDYRVSHAKISNELPLMDIYLALPMPTLFVSGTDHPLFKPIVKKLKNRGAQTIFIPRSHHFPFIDNPEEFSSKIQKFIKTR